MDNNSFKALTIIIPTYNVSKYINMCLDSVTQNEAILDDLEILVVNDGSTDDSGQKAKVYADKYPNSVILINKDNGGHGSALNVGISRAKGKYLKVLDSDDWVKPRGLEKLVDFIKTQDESQLADYILNPYEEIWEDNSRTVLQDLPKLKEYKKCFDIGVLNEFDYFPYLWHVTIRTNLYRDNMIPMLEEGIFYEDIEYYMFPIPYVKSIYYLPDIIYQYRLGSPTQSMNPKNKIKRQWMYEQVLESLYNYRNVSGEAQKMIDRRLAKMICADLSLYLLWDNMRDAKSEFAKVISKYNDLPVVRYGNRKLKFLLATRFFGFRFISYYYKKKIRKQWE